MFRCRCQIANRACIGIFLGIYGHFEMEVDTCTNGGMNEPGWISQGERVISLTARLEGSIEMPRHSNLEYTDMLSALGTLLVMNQLQLSATDNPDRLMIQRVERTLAERATFQSFLPNPLRNDYLSPGDNASSSSGIFLLCK